MHGAKGMERGGHGLAIRQVFEKAEVGRVSWQFHVRKEEEQRRRKRAERDGVQTRHEGPQEPRVSAGDLSLEV